MPGVVHYNLSYKGLDTGEVPLDFDLNLTTLKVLLAAGANPWFAGYSGLTPLARVEDPDFQLDYGQSDNPEVEVKAFRQAMSEAAEQQVQAAKARVKGLKAGDAALNALAPGGWSPLHFAIASRDAAFARQLLDLGANPNLTDLSGFSPLLLALRELPELVEPLLAHQADPNHETLQGAPLMYAIHLKRQAAVKSLLAAGARPNQAITRKDVSYDTEQDSITTGDGPLHLAVSSLQPDLVEALLAKGARPNLPDHRGGTPLLNLIKQSGWSETNTRLLERLLAAGANPWQPDQLGTSPLELVEYDLAHGEEHDKDGYFKLVLPKLQQATQARLAALKARATVQETPDAEGWTPLMSAVAAGDLALVDRLLKSGHDPNSGPAGFRPLMLAIKRPEILALLLDHGADTEAASDKGHTALFLSVYGARHDAVSRLLAASADPMARVEIDERNILTPLWFAIQAGNAALVSSLIKAGADPNAPIQNEKGYSYLHLAMYGDKEVFAALLAGGADPTRKQNGPSVLEILSDVRLRDGYLHNLEENRQALRAHGFKVEEIYTEQYEYY